MANIVQSDKENGAASFIRSTSGDCNRTGGADILLPNVQYMKRGIFTIAYEPSKWPPVPSITGSRDALLVFGRLVKDYWAVAPQTCVAYAACLLWLTLAPGLGLSFASVVLLNIQDLMLCDESHAEERLLLNVKLNVSLWLVFGVVSYFTGERMKEFKTEFSGPIRAHFLPKLVEARLGTNSDDLTDDDYGAFPHEYEYGTYLPGYEYLHTVLQRAQHVGIVLFGVIAMACITYQFPGRFDAGFLYLLTAFCVVVGLAIPLNGAGGGGYTFWTNDIDYKRLMGLFHIVFSDEHRDAAHKDGLTEYVLNEYKYSSERLRTARTDYGLISCGVPIQWYWSLPDFLMNSCAMAVYGMVTPWSKPSAQSMIATMLMLHLVVTTLKDSIGKIKNCDTPLSTSMKSVQRFYQILDRTRTQKAPLAYPVSKRCHGAALSLDNVSFKYDNHWREHAFLIENINLKIAPGQLVVITGTNGSGKSTLLKLLCGLTQPTSGSVTFDGHKLPPYEVNQHLQSVIYVGQSETVYPACSIRDHVMFGLTSRESRASVREVDVDSAVFLGEATQLVRQHGYDTILNPRSIECFVAGRKAGPSAIAALDLSAPRNLALPLSHGEKQRLAAARAFMRLNHENVRLIVLDEATNALDSIAESNILQRFREIARQKGQTMIVVTHKLANIAQCADLILCMKEGRILEHGTHDALMNVGGQYASLYRQSTACTLASSA